MNTELLKITIKNAVKQVLDEEEKKNIRKIQSTLQRIDNGERFFFNITQYENLGLVKPRDIYGTEAGSGNRVRIRTEYSLTPKAKQYLNVII